MKVIPIMKLSTRIGFIHVFFVALSVIAVTVFLLFYVKPALENAIQPGQEETAINKAIVSISILAAVIILSMALIRIYILKKTIIKLLTEITEMTRKISVGDFSPRIKVKSPDEIGRLSDSFNHMAEQLQTIQKDFDKKVEEKTKELLYKAKMAEEQARVLEDTKQALLSTFKDIKTQKDKLQEEKLKSNTLLSSIGDGVLATDREGKIILINNAAGKMLGYQESESLGQQIYTILKVADEEGNLIPWEEQPIKKAIYTGKSWANVGIDQFYIKKNGDKFPVSTTTSPVIFKENIIGAINVFRDITKEKEIEKAKSDFISLSSHQLRTPLSTINWYTEMLLEGDAGKLDKNQEKYIKEIHIGNQRMIKLVNDLLSVSRIELKTMPIQEESCDPKKVADDVIESYSTKIKEKKLSLEKNYPDENLIFKADKNILRIILENLISNAIKYTPNKGEIRVGLEKRDKEILIQVSDNGYGIPKKQQDKLFTKFFRADNIRDKETDGTGLGLYIVKSLTEKVGGKISFSSEEDKGSTFYVTIPPKS